MYRWQLEQAMKNDPINQRITMDEWEEQDGVPRDQIQYTTVMGSAAHTYGNVLAFVEKYILDLFPKDYFKTIHINSKIEHRQMIQTDLRALGKKANPKIIFRPRIANMDEDRFLKDTLLATRMYDNYNNWGGTNLQSFFVDNQHGFEIKYQLNRSVMYMDVTCVFGTYIQQINMAHMLQNRIPIGHPSKLETCLESYIPTDMINAMSAMIQLPVVDKEGCTKEFMEYLNGHSNFPITYKLSGATGKREFYRYYPTLVEVLINDISTDDGEKAGQVMTSFQMSFSVRVEFNNTGYYYIYGKDLEKYTIPSIPDDNNGELIPVFTDIMTHEDLNVKPGWHLYNQASCRLESVNDHINITELMNSSITRTITFHHQNGLPCNEFLDIRIRRQGELLTEGKDYIINYDTMDVLFHNRTVYYTYKILIYINVGYINAMLKDIYGLS